MGHIGSHLDITSGWSGHQAKLGRGGIQFCDRRSRDWPGIMDGAGARNRCGKVKRLWIAAILISRVFLPEFLNALV